MRDLLGEYKKKKSEIRKRLEDFSRVHKKGDSDIFAELCFCLLTPQAKAVICDGAVKELQKKDLLFKGSKDDIRSCLRGVRFPNNKAKYLIEARKIFGNGGSAEIRNRLKHGDISGAREWLVKNVKGMGYKEASHFLRNIGLGRDIAILDRHILKNLKRCGVIKKIPASLTTKEYLKIEKRMRDFFKRVRIPIEEVDLLFWSKETGYIYK